MGAKFSALLNRHPTLKSFLIKVGKDNIGFLASAVAWSILTSLVPIMAGVVAISGLVLQGSGQERTVIDHLSGLLQGVLDYATIKQAVDATVNNTGLLGLIGLAGILWGGSNIGGAVATVFQPVFQVRGRPFIPEKLIDFTMVFVFTALMVIIVAATTAGALLDKLIAYPAYSGVTTYIITISISLLAAFVLFTFIYLVFPNTNPRFKLRNVWLGSAVAAVLFQILTLIWPLYTHFVRFDRYSALLASLLVLTAWIYFFALILLFGAEIVSFQSLRAANAEHIPIGPSPDGTVPQRTGMRRY